MHIILLFLIDKQGNFFLFFQCQSYLCCLFILLSFLVTCSQLPAFLVFIKQKIHFSTLFLHFRTQVVVFLFFWLSSQESGAVIAGHRSRVLWATLLCWLPEGLIWYQWLVATYLNLQLLQESMCSNFSISGIFLISFEKSKTLSKKTSNRVGQNEKQTQNYLQTCAVIVCKCSPLSLVTVPRFSSKRNLNCEMKPEALLPDFLLAVHSTSQKEIC